MTLHWLSFADTELPEGTQFLGVAILEAGSFPEACLRSHFLKLNPGGEVQGLEVPEMMERHIPESFRYRLLTRAECEELDELVAKSAH